MGQLVCESLKADGSIKIKHVFASKPSYESAKRKAIITKESGKPHLRRTVTHNLPLDPHGTALVEPVQGFRVSKQHLNKCATMRHQKCSQVFVVTKLPVHECVISWMMTSARERSPATMVGVTNVKQGFSIPP